MSGEGEGYAETLKRNREEVLSRERQFQTVGESSSSERSESDSDESGSSGSSGSSRKHKAARREKKDAKREKKEAKKNKKKEKKKEKKARKKDKKEKKEKKEKKSSRGRNGGQDAKSARTAVNQDVYGRYGIVRATDMYAKQREFEAYMSEVKMLPGALGGPKREVMEHFADFMEDYNTATMPHEKFYDYERWEMEDYRRRRAEEEAGGVGATNTVDVRADEEKMRLEALAQKRAFEQQHLEATKTSLQSTAGLREAMQRQKDLEAEMAHSHKVGDSKRVKKIQDKLAPDEWKGTVYGH